MCPFEHESIAQEAGERPARAHGRPLLRPVRGVLHRQVAKDNVVGAHRYPRLTHCDLHRLAGRVASDRVDAVYRGELTGCGVAWDLPLCDAVDPDPLSAVAALRPVRAGPALAVSGEGRQT